MLSKLFKISIICLFLFTGCDKKTTTINETVSSKKSIKNNTEAHTETVSMGIEIDDESKLDKNRKAFILNKDKNFSPSIKITNDFPHKNTYSVLFLLNYRQIPVHYQNAENLVIKETVKARSTKEINIKTPVLETGTHEFLILVVRESDRHLSKKQYIPSEMINLYLRGTLIVNGGKTLPKINLKEQEVNTSTTIPKGTVYITDKNNINPISFGKLNSENRLQFNYNNEEPNKTVYVGIFQDNKQIDMKNSFLKLKDPGTFKFPFSLKLSNYTTHELMGIVVENPYQSTDSKQGNVFFTNKISITK
jgi:hypothetical protein